MILLKGFALKAQEIIKINIKENNQHPIAFVTISENNNAIAITDSIGSAGITLATGKHTLLLSCTGYESKEVIIISPVKNNSVDINLSAIQKALDEVVIVSSTRNNQRIENSPLKVEVLGREEMDEENTIKPANIASILGDISGIQIQQSSAVSGNANVRIQGLDGRYTQILKDGMPLYDGFSGGFPRLNIALGDVHLCASPGQCLGNGLANSGAGPGDNGYFPCQIEHARSLSLVPKNAGCIMIHSMPQDLLEIGREHHRNGRLTQAQASYRELLTIDPGNADAMHWLGVLYSQAAQWDDAMHWLEQAVAVRPGDAAFLHNLGQAAINSGRLQQAVAAFEAAAAFDPERAELRYFLAVALLARGAKDDAEEAVIALRQANALGMDTAELHRQLGAALLAANLPDEAKISLHVALEKNQNDAPTRYLLAIVHQRKNETAAVRKNLLKALEIDPVFSRGWSALGRLEADAENWNQAISLYRRALAIKPEDPATLNALGQALLLVGKREESMAAMREAVRASRLSSATPAGTVADLERKITLDPMCAELHYTLATVTHLTPPARIPAALLTDLYERYAGGFDEHLREKLHYRMPEMITDRPRILRPKRSMAERKGASGRMISTKSSDA